MGFSLEILNGRRARMVLRNSTDLRESLVVVLKKALGSRVTEIQLELHSEPASLCRIEDVLLTLAKALGPKGIRFVIQLGNRPLNQEIWDSVFRLRAVEIQVHTSQRTVPPVAPSVRASVAVSAPISQKVVSATAGQFPARVVMPPPPLALRDWDIASVLRAADKGDWPDLDQRFVTARIQYMQMLREEEALKREIEFFQLRVSTLEAGLDESVDWRKLEIKAEKWAREQGHLKESIAQLQLELKVAEEALLTEELRHASLSEESQAQLEEQLLKIHAKMVQVSENYMRLQREFDEQTKTRQEQKTRLEEKIRQIKERAAESS